jgi:hypothetical protein
MRRPLYSVIGLSCILFLLTLLIFVQAIPYLLYTWAITGDEPHYLLAAHSLAKDGDLDLKNNYLSGDHLGFHPGFLDPHIRQQPSGAWLMTHDVGLSVLIAPAYAWGGRAGVMQFFAVLGALLAVQMFLLGWEVTGRWWAGLAGWGAMAFSAPLALYVFQIYPEMIGSLMVIWAMRQILQTPRWLDQKGDGRPEETKGASAFVLLPLAVALLPWLSGRFTPLLFFLVGLSIWKQWPQRKVWLTTSGVALLSLAVYLITNYALFGGPTPSATVAGSAVSAGFGNIGGQQIPRGLAGWWLDQQRGLLVYGPILAVALIGLPHLWRLRGLDGLLLGMPIVIMWLLASVWGGFYIAWEISARFLMVGVPLLVAGIAAALAGIRGRAQRWLFYPLVAALATLSLLNTVIVMLNPFVAFHESPIRFYEEATHWQLRPWLPAMGTRLYIAPPTESGWQAASGQAGYLYQSPALDNLSVGWYRLYAQAQISGSADPTANVLGFDIYSSETGLPLLRADVRAADFNPATGTADIALAFFNPYLNKWDFPFYLDIQATGLAGVRLSPLLLEQDPLPTYGRVLGWVVGLGLLTVFLGWPKK